MSRVLITGVAGFVGSSIAEAILSSTDSSVIGVDCFTPYYADGLKRRNIDRLRDYSEKFSLVELDLSAGVPDSLVDGVEFVFHQAGQPGVRRSWGSEFSVYTANNIAATQHLLEAFKDSTSLRRFIYASSSSVYGDAKRYPVLESDLPRPKSPYGVTKLAAEHLCGLYSENFGLPTASLRYFTVYGPRQRPDMAFTRFLVRALAGEPIFVFGDGRQVRDFTYVDDVVKANLQCMDLPAPSGLGENVGLIMNVSGGSSVSVNEVLEIVAATVGRKLDVRYGSSVSGDVKRTGGDSALLRSLLGWVPDIQIAEGLRRHAEWAESNLSYLIDPVLMGE